MISPFRIEPHFAMKSGSVVCLYSVKLQLQMSGNSSKPAKETHVMVLTILIPCLALRVKVLADCKIFVILDHLYLRSFKVNNHASRDNHNSNKKRNKVTHYKAPKQFT